MRPAYPHEKRVQRYGYLAFAASALLAALVAFRGDARLVGIALPAGALYALAAAGLVAGAVAVHRRATPIALVAAALLVLAVLPGGDLRPDATDYALGLAFGLALLVAVELVHMTVRYERAHKAVDEGVPEEHVNRVTDEALKTLVARSGLALLVAAAGVALAFLLARLGPAAWRAAVETKSPVGVALAGLVVLGALALVVLIGGATFRRTKTQETTPDVAE